MRRVACHSGEALLFAVYDGCRCRGGSGRWGTVFCAVAGAVPARLGTAPAPARGVADQTSGGEPDPKSPSTGRGAWRPCTPRGSPPAAPLRGGAADSQGRRRTAGPLRASAWPTRAAPPPARARETSPAPVPQRVAGACGAGQVRPSAGRGCPPAERSERRVGRRAAPRGPRTGRRRYRAPRASPPARARSGRVESPQAYGAERCGAAVGPGGRGSGGGPCHCPQAGWHAAPYRGSVRA